MTTEQQKIILQDSLARLTANGGRLVYKHGILRIPVPGKERQHCGACRALLLAPPSAELKRDNPPSRLAARNNANARIAMEFDRQIELCGDGPLPKGIRRAVLTEEVGEVAKAMQDETDKEMLTK